MSFLWVFSNIFNLTLVCWG